MANHFRRDARAEGVANGSSSAGKPGARKAAIVIGLTLLALVLLGIVLFVLWQRTNGESKESGSKGEAKVETVSPKTDDGNSSGEPAGNGLPFSLTGVSSNAPVVKVKEGETKASLADEWTFGGDYREIGSFPIDGSTVFGSFTDDPDNLLSYAPALIGTSGGKRLGSASAASGDGYFEPQDGTGNSKQIVWRSARVNDSNAFGVDDWQISRWSAKDNEVRVLASAESVNGRNDTPSIVGEVVPTANDDYAFFASNVLAGDSSWECDVLAMPVDGGDVRKLGEGSFPAAVSGGVLFATSRVSDGHYAKVCSARNGSLTAAKTRLTVKSGSDQWGVTGVWASGNYKAVSFSPASASSQTYVGLWSGDFEKPVIWLVIPSGSVVASMNDRWFVWGSGSQGENAGMYAYRWSDGKTLYLGTAKGYSRPAISEDGDVVMVPETDGNDAARYHVGKLD